MFAFGHVDFCNGKDRIKTPLLTLQPLKRQSRLQQMTFINIFLLFFF